ncbi:Sortase (surface protein transpeptidase) [Actinomyces bovis]|uniref:Sortase (Surface protein transpeptidase) n=1 Tax=Actinomyces bovis TaxID=1658 RepID=A0ABY1VQI2_9ACTO|nr:Sortase (surface protein transpeptidase) [Actinomyces bovis]VEG56063.1 Sortase (surface protein transpeptidase) [Actinomyces israelii]
MAEQEPHEATAPSELPPSIRPESARDDQPSTAPSRAATGQAPAQEAFPKLEATRAAAPVSRKDLRRAPAHARKPKRRSILDILLTLLGELLITAGAVVGLFLVWQIWWTGIEATQKAEVATKAFTQIQVESPKTTGTKHTDAPPVMPKAAYGETIGMLVIPKWYGITNNNMPIQEGTGPEVLDQAAAGHYADTQQVGEVGNFAMAGHRRSNGNSFRRVDLLEPGDEIVVSTKDTWYVYQVESHEIVLPSQTEVIAPVPGHPELPATDRYLTMTTCHSVDVGEWGNDHRWIVHAKFAYWMPRSEGRPESVLKDPEVN